MDCSMLSSTAKVDYGDNSTVGLGSVVVKDVAADDTVAGVPASSLAKIS